MTCFVSFPILYFQFTFLILSAFHKAPPGFGVSTVIVGVVVVAGMLGLMCTNVLDMGQQVNLNWTGELLVRLEVIEYKSSRTCFPSNKYEEFLRDGVDVASAPFLRLFLDWVKLNFANSVVRARTIKYMLVDQLHNLYEFLLLFANVYLVDYVAT